MRTRGFLRFVPIGVLIAVAIGASICGCGSGASTVPSGTSPTIPTINSLSPTSTTAGGPGFTLTVLGSNFVSSSVVRWNGTAKPTNFVSSAQLTAQISANDIAATGTVAITVFDTAPGGGTSSGVNFNITSAMNPVPTINSLSPSGAPVGGNAFTLSVSGLNFVSTSVVRWNGAARPTNFVSSAQITAQIPASDIAATGTADVTVFNPAPGGGSSNTLTFTIPAGGTFPQSVAMDPAGKFAYVADYGDLNFFRGIVSMYAINPTTGALTFIGWLTAADFGSHSVAVDSSGKFAYVANVGDPDICATPCGSVSMYAINATSGALMPIGAINAGDTPFSVAVDPTGKFVYVANEGGFAPTSVSMYTINATTGALTAIGTIAGGGRATSVAVDPSGKFAYVTNSDSNDVSMYTINTVTGALTSIGTIAAGAFPSATAIDPSGKFAYVTNSNSNDVSMYTINTTTGALTSIGPIAAGTGPSSVAIDPTGKFTYVSNSGSNDISMYTINTTTGALTSIGTIATELFPTSIAIAPSGKFAYVANSQSNTVSMYSIDAGTGTLTLIGTISS